MNRWREFLLAGCFGSLCLAWKRRVPAITDWNRLEVFERLVEVDVCFLGRAATDRHLAFDNGLENHLVLLGGELTLGAKVNTLDARKLTLDKAHRKLADRRPLFQGSGQLFLGLAKLFTAGCSFRLAPTACDARGQV